MTTLDTAYVVVNVTCVVASLTLLVIYHVWMVRTVLRKPSRTVFGLNAAARRAWVVSVMKKKQDILAVQSFRNWIMGSSLLASTAIIIVFGFVAFVSSVGTHETTTITTENPLAGQFGFVLDTLFGFKILAILIVYMSSFFCFANAIRFFNHCGLVMNISACREDLMSEGIITPINLPVPPVVAAAMLNRGAFFNTLGMRGYYISFPIIAYLWGPWALLVATILVILVMRYMDMHIDPETKHVGEVGEYSEDVDLERSSGGSRLQLGSNKKKDNGVNERIGVKEARANSLGSTHTAIAATTATTAAVVVVSSSASSIASDNFRKRGNAATVDTANPCSSSATTKMLVKEVSSEAMMGRADATDAELVMD